MTATTAPTRSPAPAPPLLLVGEAGVRTTVVVLTTVVVGTATAVQPMLGVGCLVLVAGTLGVLARPEIAGFVLCAVVPVTAGLRRGLVVPGLKISELLICWLAATVLLTCSQQWRARWHDLDRLFLAYVAVTLLLGLYGLVRRDSVDLENAGEALGPLQFLLAYRLVLTTLVTARQRWRGLALVLLSSIPVGLVTLCQQFDVGPVRQVLIQLTGSTQAPGTVDPWAVTDRATGPFAHWFGLAGYLLVILLIAIALLLARTDEVLSPFALCAVAGLAMIALLCTLTFVALAAAAAGALALGWRHRRTGLVVGCLLGALVAGQTLLGEGFDERYAQQAGAAVSESGIERGALPSTIQFRVDLWQDQLLPAVREHLVLGYGPGMPSGLTWGATESVYLTLLLRGGIPLLVVYAFLVVSMWRRSRRAASLPAGPDSVLGHALAVVIVVSSGMQLTSVLFTDAGFPHALWACLALLGRQEDRSFTATVAGPRS